MPMASKYIRALAGIIVFTVLAYTQPDIIIKYVHSHVPVDTNHLWQPVCWTASWFINTVEHVADESR